MLKMPSTKKKTPATSIRKKVTAFARAQTLVRKAKTVSNELNSSYLQPVSTVSAIVHDTATTTNAQAARSSSNNAILSLLQDMNKSTQDVVRRIDALERQQSANSTTIAVRSQSRVHSHLALFPTHPVLDPTQGHQVEFQGLQITGKVPRELSDPPTVDHSSTASQQPPFTTTNTLQCQDSHRCAQFGCSAW